ncbi:MAG: AAA family ATPase [Candidatus Anstonellales archaeon]
MYVIKYHPKNLDDYFRYYGGEEVFIRSSIEMWIKNPDKPLLIYSPPGTGKTALVYALANTYNMNIYEINSFNVKDVDLKTVSKYDLHGRRTLILIDDIDAILETSRFDVDSILDLKIPIIMTANDIWNVKMKDIRAKIQTGAIQALELKISKITYTNLIRSIIRREKIDLSEDELRTIVELNYPDIRAGINDLEIRIGTGRDRLTNIFQVMNTILTTKPKMIDVKNYLDRNLNIDDYRNLIPFIEWNLTLRYDGEELKKAYEYISLADIFFFHSSIHRRWNLFTYTSRFISFIATLKNSNSRSRIELNRIRIPVMQDSNFHQELHMSQKKYKQYGYLFKNIFT